MMMNTAKRGIDVSRWQGNIDWAQAKKSGLVDFAIIQAGYGKESNQVDEQFENNYKGCKANNIPCGAYWYSYATTVEDAEREANVCIATLKGKQFEYPIYFDIEEPRQQLGMGKVSAIVSTFCNKLEAAGYWVGIYSNRSFLKTYITEELRRRYAVWIAEYDTMKPLYESPYGIWQKSSKGKILGISGNVDLNEGYVDYPSAIKSAGKNGYTKPVMQQSAKPTEKKKVKVEVLLDGHKYSGFLEEV